MRLFAIVIRMSYMTGEAAEEKVQDSSQQDAAGKPEGKPTGFWSVYGSKIALAVFAGYLVLLAIGVVAEVFKIQSILDWWIWKPPGKP